MLNLLVLFLPFPFPADAHVGAPEAPGAVPGEYLVLMPEGRRRGDFARAGVRVKESLPFGYTLVATDRRVNLLSAVRE